MPDHIAVKICLYFRHVSCSSSQSLRPAHSFHQCCCWRQLGEQCALLGEQEMWWSNADKRGAFFAPQCPRAQQSCPCPAAPFCEQHWLMTILSGQIFLWKLACPLGREGGALTCQRARLHTYFCNNWALFIVFGGFFFFLKLLRKHLALKFTLCMKMHESFFIHISSIWLEQKSLRFSSFKLYFFFFLNNGDSNIPKQF